jgi:hypothetical protein
MSSRKNIRNRIANTQSNKCYYCDCDMILTQKSGTGRRRTLEHLERRADGGSNKQHNLVVCCSSCNGSRGEYTPELWKLICIDIKKVRLNYRQNKNAFRRVFNRRLVKIGVSSNTRATLCRVRGKFHAGIGRTTKPEIPLEVLEKNVVKSILHQQRLAA